MAPRTYMLIKSSVPNTHTGSSQPPAVPAPPSGPQGHPNTHAHTYAEVSFLETAAGLLLQYANRITKGI